MALLTANGRDAVYVLDNDGQAVAWYGSPDLLSNPLIPGTKDPNNPTDPGVKILGGVRAGDAGIVLIEVARRFHLRVRRAVQAEGWWGYNFRTIRGGDGSTLSTHSGGWAVDCASGVFLQGRRTMTAAQRAECAAIEADLEVVRWGGWWTGGSSDEMHFEIRAKVADGDITRVANQIRATWAGQAPALPKRKIRRDKHMNIVMTSPSNQRPHVIVDLAGIQVGLGDGWSSESIRKAIADPTQLAVVSPADFDRIYAAVAARIGSQDVDDELAAIAAAVTAMDTTP